MEPNIKDTREGCFVIVARLIILFGSLLISIVAVCGLILMISSATITVLDLIEYCYLIIQALVGFYAFSYRGQIGLIIFAILSGFNSLLIIMAVLIGAHSSSGRFQLDPLIAIYQNPSTSHTNHWWCPSNGEDAFSQQVVNKQHSFLSWSNWASSCRYCCPKNLPRCTDQAPTNLENRTICAILWSLAGLELILATSAAILIAFDFVGPRKPVMSSQSFTRSSSQDTIGSNQPRHQPEATDKQPDNIREKPVEQRKPRSQRSHLYNAQTVRLIPQEANRFITLPQSPITLNKSTGTEIPKAKTRTGSKQDLNRV